MLAKLRAGRGARITHLPTNSRGRDLIVGDLHGHRRTLDHALRALAFNPATDRLLAVGDLIDRGPDSPGCLSLLAEPWFHAVKGNHEDLMLGTVRELGGVYGTDTRHAIHQNNGGSWLKQLWPPHKELADWIERARSLPHVLVVGQERNRYHVVHAGFAEGITDALIDQGRAGDPESLMWSRQRGQTLRDSAGTATAKADSSELSTTYFGHVVCPTASGEPARGFAHVNLETGVAKGLHLTIAIRTPEGGEHIHQERCADPTWA